jgi:CDP-4-dehydro-6-deoxyglucose reductase
MTFNITVEPSARTFTTDSGEAILAGAIRQGVSMPYGCKDGACGSCKCKKLSGSVMHGDHQSKALSAQEEADGFILTCCAVAQSDVVLESKQVTAADALPIKRMPVRVTSLTKVNDDVALLRLQLPANDTFKYHAGQYIEFLLREGDRRSYSMANAPHTQTDSPGLDLHIRHMPGGKFTDHVFGVMKDKDILRVEGPFGSFYLREDSDKPMVFVASGTGFAPIKALLEDMAFKGITRPTTVYWGGRQPIDLYLHDWMQAQADASSHITYVPVVSNATPTDHWTGRTGFVHQAVLDDFADLSLHHIYACGAPVVVESAQRDFVQLRGLPSDAFFADSFTSEADKATSPL